MKKLLFTLVPAAFVLAACSTPPQQSTVPMDMKTVQEYQQRVSSGNTVAPNAQPNTEALNQSDHRKAQRVDIYHHESPRIRPSIGYHYGRGGYRHSGVNLGVGYY